MKKNDMFGMIMAVMVVILVLGALPALVTVMTDNNDVQVGRPSDVETASYIIYKDGDYTCAKNGTTGRIEARSENASHVIQSALDYESGDVLLASGSYDITYTIHPRSNTKLIGNNAILVMDPSLNYAITNDPYVWGKTIFSTFDLEADALVGAKTFTVADASVFSTGDLIHINSNATLNNYTIGETNIVESVNEDTDTVRVALPLAFNYRTTNNAHVTTISDPIVNFGIKDLTIVGWDYRGLNSLTVGIRLFYSVNTTISNVNIRSVGYEGIGIYHSYNGIIDGANIQKIETAGAGYGAVIIASTGCTIRDSTFQWCRHGTDAGTINGTWSRDVSFIDNLYLGTEFERVHDPTINYRYLGCMFDGVCSVLLSGMNGTISDSRILNSPLKCWRDYTWTVALILGPYNCADGVEIRGTNTGSKYAVRCYAGTSASNLLISNIDNGIEVCGSQVRLTNCIINTTTGQPILRSSLVAGGNNVSITNCYIYSSASSNSLWAINLNTWKDVNIDSCTIAKAQRGIMISSGSVSRSTIKSTITDYCINFGSNTRIESNVLYGALVADASSSNVQITNNKILSGNVVTVAIDINKGNKIILSGNQFSYACLYGYSKLFDCTNITIDANQKLTTNKAVYYTIGTCLRIVVDGVGTNGANDPASAGEWLGFAYEGLFVKWNNGATHYLSVYRGGAWFDMTLA